MNDVGVRQTVLENDVEAQPHPSGPPQPQPSKGDAANYVLKYLPFGHTAVE